jgi:hypothetical protein
MGTEDPSCVRLGGSIQSRAENHLLVQLKTNVALFPEALLTAGDPRSSCPIGIGRHLGEKGLPSPARRPRPYRTLARSRKTMHEGLPTGT